jgi:uncharacterized Zn-binding protein involved in type VI secretion
MNQFAARITDPVAHPLPPVLTGGPVSANVLIEALPAWRGMSAADLAALMQTVKQAQTSIDKAKLATTAAKGTPGEGVAKANEEKTILDETKRVADAIAGLAAKGVSIHACASLLPTPAPGVVITGSQTVLINGLPACRMGDTIFEGIHVPNAIAAGCPTVIIGG